MLHSCEQTPRHAAAWGRGARGIRQNFFCRLRATPFKRALCPDGAAFHGRGASTNFHFAASSIASSSRRPDQARRQGRGIAILRCHARALFGCGSCLLLPLMPMEACFLTGESVRTKKQSETFKPPTVVCFAVSSRAARMWRRCTAGKHCPQRRSLPCLPAPARRG